MIFQSSLLFLVCCIFSWSEARRGPLNFGIKYRGLFESENGAEYRTTKSNYTTYYIEQPLDHHDPSNKQTFRQRYWVEDAFYKPGGPIIFSNAGESDAYPADGYLDGSVFRLMAKEMDGLIIIIEHRFYGKSHPPLSEKTQWEFLSVNQSLADMAKFMQQKKLDGIKGDISAPKNKWIVRGGSYSGNISAWMRKIYPDLVFAAVSSSAPVQAQYNFYQYYDPMIQYGSPRCIAALHNIVEMIDQFFASKPLESEKAQFKQGFGVNTTTSDADFAYDAMLPAIELWQGASTRNFPFDSELCTIFTNVKDPKKQFQIYQKWAKGVLEEEKGYHTPQTDRDEKAWTWQVCSEFGYYQVSPPANTTWYNRRVMSNLVTTDVNDEDCKKLFNRTTPPAIQTINNIYQGWDLHLNRTIWINGEWDPWRPLSVASNDAPKRQNSTYELYFMIPHGVHCFDYAVSPVTTELHKATISTLKEWFK